MDVIFGRPGQVGPNGLNFTGDIGAKREARALWVKIAHQWIAQDTAFFFIGFYDLIETVGSAIRSLRRFFVWLNEIVDAVLFVLRDTRRANHINGLLGVIHLRFTSVISFDEIENMIFFAGFHEFSVIMAGINTNKDIFGVQAKFLDKGQATEQELNSAIFRVLRTRAKFEAESVLAKVSHDRSVAVDAFVGVLDSFFLNMGIAQGGDVDIKRDVAFPREGNRTEVGSFQEIDYCIVVAAKQPLDGRPRELKRARRAARPPQRRGTFLPLIISG